MPCPACNQRKARRDCPALGQKICSICCGTKRLTEINCPPDCPHLASAREHPAAVVRRQQERDVAILLPTIRHLTERQYQLFFLFQTTIARHKPEGFVRLVDEDVAQAAATLAATLETAARGVIYEHVADSRPAQRLIGDLKALLEQVRQQGARVYDREAAIVLRAIEAGARDAKAAGGDDTSYLTLVGRLMQGAQVPALPEAAGEEAKPAPSSLIIPGT
jgi:hypothetical protein